MKSNVQKSKSAVVGLRMDPVLKEAAMQAASDDHRTLTSLIEKLLTDYCRDRGYLPSFGLDQPAALAIGPSEEGGFQRPEVKRFARADQAIRFALFKLSGSQQVHSRLLIADQTLNFEQMQTIYEAHLVPLSEQEAAEKLESKMPRRRSAKADS